MMLSILLFTPEWNLNYFGFHGFFEGPVVAPLCALGDPALEHRDLLWIEGRLVGLRGRHELLGIRGDDALHEIARLEHFARAGLGAEQRMLRCMRTSFGRRRPARRGRRGSWRGPGS